MVGEIIIICLFVLSVLLLSVSFNYKNGSAIIQFALLIIIVNISYSAGKYIQSKKSDKTEKELIIDLNKKQDIFINKDSTKLILKVK